MKNKLRLDKCIIIKKFYLIIGKLKIDVKNNDNESRSNSHFRLQNFIKYDEKLSYRSHFADQNDI